jgi:4-hydroxy-tetrahydrodipicolinate synthase
VAGAHGFTSGLANVAPEIPLAMLTALRENDLGAAMKIWESARRFEELRLADSSADNVSVVKDALAQLGLCRADVGRRAARCRLRSRRRSRASSPPGA